VSTTQSDAFVFFGATGDLAYKKIFPALQAMIKRGTLTVPVIGVAKSGWGLNSCASAPAAACRSTAGSTREPLPSCWRAVEVAWSIVEPILGDRTPLSEYAPGTWGPPEADKLTAHDGGWHKPGES
jgi:glucose-6-phosphate 1-dehydrogenase